MAQSRKSGGALLGVAMVSLALALIFVPLLVGGAIKMSGLAQFVVAGFGVLLLLVGGIIIIISRLYVRASADESFVRTGQGGQKAIIDGGALVIPVIHTITWVSHTTMKLVVVREGRDALITGDNLRADVIAEFYIRVPKNKESTIAAASSLGESAMNPEELKKLVFQKLENALRTVAGTQPLMKLHADRQSFRSAVDEIVKRALEANGLSLEETTISKLDQTPKRQLEAEDNIFDAQGARAIAEITAEQRVKRNQIERQADREVKNQDVETKKAILAREVEEQQAAAEAEQAKAEARARADAEAKKVTEDQNREAELARVVRERAVAVADVERQRDQDVAEEQRQQAKRAAEIAKDRAVEVALREKQIAVAEKERDRATAEAEWQKAEASATTEREAVKTVEVKANADREKERLITEEQAEIEKERLRKQMEADVDAYKTERAADAEQKAAAQKAEATRIKATADKDAAALKAEGDKAVQMVPVDVESKQVEVEAQRVEVARQELANKAEFESISKGLTLALEEITANKEVRIAMAEAMGRALANVNMTLWGDPTTFAAMTQAFSLGQQGGKLIEGVATGTPPEVKEFLSGTVESVTGSIGALVRKFTGVEVDEATIAAIAELIGKRKAAAARPAEKPVDDVTDVDPDAEDAAS